MNLKNLFKRKKQYSLEELLDVELMRKYKKLLKRKKEIGKEWDKFGGFNACFNALKTPCQFKDIKTGKPLSKDCPLCHGEVCEGGFYYQRGKKPIPFTKSLKGHCEPCYIDIKRKDIKGNYKVKIDLRKLKGSRKIEECHCGPCEKGKKDNDKKI